MLTPRRTALAALALAVGTIALGAAEAWAAPATVAISSYAFGPAQATISAGDTVTWTNNDTAAHDVASIGGPGPIKSPKLAKGQTYAQSFATSGMFRYVCTFHPDMLGTVTVKAVVSPSLPAARPAAPAATTPAAAAPAAAAPRAAPTPTTATAGAAGPATAPPAVAPPVAAPADVALAEAPAEPATATSSDVGRARIHPLLFLAAVVTAVVVGGTISLVEAGRRRPGTG